MILVTIDYVPGYEVTEVIGVIHGSTVRARFIAKDIIASIKNIIGGEIEEYTNLQRQARMEALHRLKQRAQSIGADAVLGIRFSTSMIAQGASEIMAYGTAVKIRPIAQSELPQ